MRLLKNNQFRLELDELKRNTIIEHKSLSEILMFLSRSYPLDKNSQEHADILNLLNELCKELSCANIFDEDEIIYHLERICHSRAALIKKIIVLLDMVKNTNLNHSDSEHQLIFGVYKSLILKFIDFAIIGYIESIEYFCYASPRFSEIFNRSINGSSPFELFDEIYSMLKDKNDFISTFSGVVNFEFSLDKAIIDRLNSYLVGILEVINIRNSIHA